MDSIVLLPLAASPSPRLLSSARCRRTPSVVSAVPPSRRRSSADYRAAASRASLSTGFDLSAPAMSGPSMGGFEQLDVTNMLLKQRIVFLGSEVEATTADFIISQLLLLDAEDTDKDITLFINSPGGSVTAAMAIYDTMKLCRADVSTVCFGIAASAGALLLASGTKGKRFCMPNARVMIQQSHGSAGGGALDAAIRIRELSYHLTKMIKILSRITRKSEQQIRKDTKHPKFMNAWEAREYGLVDAVVDDGKRGLVAPVVDMVPPLLPDVWHLWDVPEGQRDTAPELPSETKLGKVTNDDKKRGAEQAKDEV